MCCVHKEWSSLIPLFFSAHAAGRCSSSCCKRKHRHPPWQGPGQGWRPLGRFTPAPTPPAACAPRRTPPRARLRRRPVTAVVGVRGRMRVAGGAPRHAADGGEAGGAGPKHAHLCGSTPGGATHCGWAGLHRAVLWSPVAGGWCHSFYLCPCSLSDTTVSFPGTVPQPICYTSV